MTKELEQQLDIQSGRCAICEKAAQTFSVDKDFTRNLVRGLVCRSCAKGLRNFNKNPDWVERAFQYLRGFYSNHMAIRGWVEYELRGPDGELKLVGAQSNLVTDTGDKFYGDRAAVILGSTVNISSSTNAAPIVITTSSAHGFAPSDKVVVASHTTNTNANGTWDIQAITSTTITLRGTTGNGVGGAAGTVQSFTTAMVSGMRLGTGSTAAAKTGAGAAIVTYVSAITASKAIDGGFPTSSQPGGAGTARQIQWKTTWNAGEATQNGLAEVVLTVEQPLTDVAGSAANTIARALLSPTVNKGASDTLAVTWNHNILGA